MPPPPRFGIALRPQDRPVDLPKELRKTLKNEFYARYLESIGAAPTPGNMAEVKKNMPIDSCQFTTAWKSRGWVSDYLYIAPKKSSASNVPTKSSLASDSSSNELAPLLNPEALLKESSPEAQSAQEAVEISPNFGAPTGSMSFEEAKKTFLYPYKRDTDGASKPGTSRLSASSRARPQTSERDDEHGDAHDFQSRDFNTYEQYTEEEVYAELKTVLNIHTKDIIVLQAEFVASFPFETLKARMSEEDMRIGLNELSSKRTTRFIGLLSLLMYWSFIAERAQQEVEEEQLSALFCGVQHFFASVRERMKRRRATLLFMLPTLLLLVRVCVEAVFRQAFPKWWTTVDAKQTLKRIDDAIEALFDPNAYHSHISPLESNATAIRIAAKEQAGVKPRSRNSKYFATSSLVSSALPQSSMVTQHRRQAGTSLPMVANKLPDDARRQLFKAALSRTAAPAGAASASKIHAELASQVTSSAPIKKIVNRAEEDAKKTPPHKQRMQPTEEPVHANYRLRTADGGLRKSDAMSGRASASQDGAKAAMSKSLGTDNFRHARVNAG